MEFESRSNQPPVLTADERCLRLFPHDDWTAFEQRIVARSKIDPDARDYVRAVLSHVAETPIDGQGRISVPQFLRDLAHLTRDVILVGMGDDVEIWDADRYLEKTTQSQTGFRGLAKLMAEHDGS